MPDEYTYERECREIDEEIDKMIEIKDKELKENTFVAVKLKDVPEKTRFALMSMGKACDMLDKEFVIKLLENRKLETLKDIITARGCLNYQNMICNNEECLNESCPSNKKYDK